MPPGQSQRNGEDESSRFSWLLQPIRDLTKNWDIDVASQLEDYLGELESISISFDNGKTTMNFAEAALVIQGSACVYNKKVEYLYTLVYETLGILSSKKGSQNELPENEQKKNTAMSNPELSDDLLNLDDITPAKNINLIEDFNEMKNQKGVRMIPRIPFALLPKTEMNNRGEDVLLSCSGEVIGSRNDFKINTCIIHQSGCLLLDTDSQLLFEKHHGMLQQKGPIDPVDNDLDAIRNLSINENRVADGGQGDVSFESVGFQDCPASPIMSPEENGVQICQDGNDNYRELRPRGQQNGLLQEVCTEDPFKLLDPYEEMKSLEKPFKKGKPFKIPKSLSIPMEDSKKRKRKRNPDDTKCQQNLIPIADFILGYYKQNPKVPNIRRKYSKYPEFDYLFLEEHAKRQEILRKKKKLLTAKLTMDQLAEIESIAEKGTEEESDDEDDNADDNDDNDINMVDFDEPNPFEAENAAEKNRTRQSLSFDDPGLQADNLPSNSYEDLVRKYVDDYLKKAENYIQETDLSQRVKCWEERIMPILKEEEMHRPFDIHEYGQEMLESSSGSVFNFEEFVKKKEHYEVGRYFLSALLLANMQNVEIETEGADGSMDNLKLKILDKTPLHQAISDYKTS